MDIDYLKENILYNPDTGLCTWILSGKKRIINNEIGTLMSSGYRSVLLLGKRYYIHRLVWFYCFEEWPTLLDHINRVKSDNRLDNLREVTQTVNMHNRLKTCNNTSGYKGVFTTASNKFKSQIYFNKKLYYLGTFNSAIEASEAYINFENNWYNK